MLLTRGSFEVARIGKTSRVPKTRAGGEWTEAAFWSFVRSGVRQLSRRWPPIVRHALHAARRPLVPKRGNQKWEYQCAACLEWHKGTDVHVDHITECGTLKSFADLSTFAERLFCESDGLRVLCHACHDKRRTE